MKTITLTLLSLFAFIAIGTAQAKKVVINWTTGLIRETFKIDKKGDDFPLLVRWLDVHNDLTDEEKQLLEKRRRKLLPNVQGWNEETLKMKFIALILDMVDYDSELYQGVFEVRRFIQ